MVCNVKHGIWCKMDCEHSKSPLPIPLIANCERMYLARRMLAGAQGRPFNERPPKLTLYKFSNDNRPWATGELSKLQKAIEAVKGRALERSDWDAINEQLYRNRTTDSVIRVAIAKGFIS
ncbi:MAG: hypothetical protein S4CHLAM37_17050 [Chlamydiia bacterium]|nr:hypothetical protein [Chlamydiia bacterium]